MKSEFRLSGNVVDIFQKRIYNAEITVSDQRIVDIKEKGELVEGQNFIMPGFTDAHVHIESSMLIPSEFARMAVVHGTVATVSDPHEIANVNGMEGVKFMIENGNTVPFKFNFGAPSCVPATQFETAGAEITAKEIDELLHRDDILYMSEMMNFPGVLNGDPAIMEKIAIAKKYQKPVDGHAPGLTGDLARHYINAGISTDHECFTESEALDKLKNGMKILIREGSAAKNFDALINLLHDHENMIMFCSDDKHPDSLELNHIDELCRRAVIKGIDIFKILRAACVNPVLHYKLKVGLLRKNDFADFLLVKDLEKFEVIATYINGEKVAEDGKTLIKSVSATTVNNFNCKKRKAEDFLLSGKNIQLNSGAVAIIEALDGQLITKTFEHPVSEVTENITHDIANDILKISVINRYQDALVATALIRNFGLKKGAIASSVAHDSHNIVVVGADDESMARAANLVIDARGGISSTDGDSDKVLPLPVAGLMSKEDGYKVAHQYAELDRSAKDLGSQLTSPFMTLSFMALLVIPELKLSDKGLFDGKKFELVNGEW